MQSSRRPSRPATLGFRGGRTRFWDAARMSCTPRRFSLPWSLLLLAGVASSGCGSGEKLYSATGTVKFDDGQPLTHGWITFERVSAESPLTARGDLDAQGNFQLGTFAADDGAAEGDYRVSIAAPIPDGVYEPLERIDARFSDFATSDLRCRVTDDPAQNQFEFRVARPGANAK